MLEEGNNEKRNVSEVLTEYEGCGEEMTHNVIVYNKFKGTMNNTIVAVSEVSLCRGLGLAGPVRYGIV